ncbi:MAG: hypothetical protein JWM11_6004 [Planctomycetaceae bacterium]|nr:hypothetical protein [Planctomycetaceae bacterium]
MTDSPPAATSESQDPPEPAAFWLRRGDQLFVGVLVLAGLAMLTWTWIRLNGQGVPLIEVDRLPSRQYEYQLDINRAEWIEWTLLEGIGEKLAQRIVTFREEHGKFAAIEDLRRVPGIGPKTFERIRPWLTVATTPDPASGLKQ